MSGAPVKWRWGLYGLAIGFAFVVGGLLLEAGGYQLWPWTPHLRGDLGFSGMLLIPGIIGLVAGFIRDRFAS